MPLIVLETGRALIDDAGYLIGTVLLEAIHPTEGAPQYSTLELIYFSLHSGTNMKFILQNPLLIILKRQQFTVRFA